MIQAQFDRLQAVLDADDAEEGSQLSKATAKAIADGVTLKAVVAAALQGDHSGGYAGAIDTVRSLATL